MSKINGFEIHNGVTDLDENQTNVKIKPIFKDIHLGWYIEKSKNCGIIAGTYVHGIFENDDWRNHFINLIRQTKNLPILDKKTMSYKIKRESIIENLATEFDRHLNLLPILN